VGYRRFKLDPGKEKAGTPLRAAALQYDPQTGSAPRVVASGQRKIAEQILREARKHNIPIHEDPALAAALASVDLGAEIPPELYLVVAEVLAYVYRVAGKTSF
jgi:flagellar biosynthesis protein